MCEISSICLRLSLAVEGQLCWGNGFGAMKVSHPRPLWPQTAGRDSLQVNIPLVLPFLATSILALVLSFPSCESHVLGKH